MITIDSPHPEAVSTPSNTTSGRGRFSIPAYLGLIAVYLLILQGVGRLLTRGLDTTYAAPTTITELVRGMTIPIGLSLVLGLAAVAALRWWRPAFTEARRVRPWVIAIPIIQAVTILAVVNYGGLAEKGIAFTALLLVTCLFVGFGEELMFRGIGLTVFRTNGFSEGRAALWTTAIFGLAHATNLFSEGPGAFGQVFAAAVSGYFFYLTRRRTGGLVVPAVVHGLWDFSLISGAVVAGASHPASGLALLAVLVMAALVLAKRKQIEPEAGFVEVGAV